MISSEVQRTLVKSPPELWAELSDPAALARHLGEFGEIRIIRTEPESTVEWAAEHTSGTVSIRPSGWGTNVKLTVTREIAEPTLAAGSGVEPCDASPVSETAPAEPPSAREGVADGQAPATVEPEPAAIPAPEPAPTLAPEPASAVEPAMAEPALEPQPRRGFFARLFGRRRSGQPVEGPPESASDAFAAVRQVLAPESFAHAHPFAAPTPPPTPTPTPTPVPEPTRTPTPAPMPAPSQTLTSQPGDISAEPMAAEEVAAAEVTGVLTAVLDRLGAAHHRPFSRA